MLEVIPKCRSSFVFWGVPPRFARGRAAAGFAGAPSRLWRDRPFASLTQGGGAALEAYTNYNPAFGITARNLFLYKCQIK
jgi:hypothetical protein